MNPNWGQVALAVLTMLFAIALGALWYFLKVDKLETAVWTGFAVWVIVGLTVVALIYQYVLVEPDTSGLLRPANEPTPPNPCPTIPKDALLLLFGDSASYTTAFPQTVLRAAGQDLLSIDQKNGAIAVSAKIYSADGNIVAGIIDNNFHINPSNYFRRERPDRHTLTVFDQRGQRVLYVRHINSSAVKVLGLFYGPKGISIRIEENGVILPGNNVLSRNCFGNAKVAININ